MKSLIKFLKYPSALKILCVRVFLLAFYYKFLIKSRSFQSIAGRLGKMGNVSSEDPLSAAERQRVLLIRRAIRAVVLKLHFSNECLVCAFTAKKLLGGIPATVYMGVAKKKDGSMEAHAWTRAGDVIVTGEEGRERFTVTATFA